MIKVIKSVVSAATLVSIAGRAMTKAYLQRFVVGLSLTAETYNDNCNGNRKFKNKCGGSSLRSE
jgi:hypothetical protein